MVLNVEESFDQKELAAIKNRVLGKERNLRTAYFDEVGLREGQQRWKFIKTFNKLISGETAVLAALGAAQKSLVDEWNNEDFEEMKVTKEEVMRELEYEEVLKPLSRQHDDIEMRKRRIRERIAETWEEEWEVDFDDNMLPPWQSEHFLQQISYLADEFPNQGQAIGALKKAMIARGTRRRSRNTKFLITQDVKDAIELMRKKTIKEEVESEASSPKAPSEVLISSSEREEDIAYSSTESDTMPPPRKRPRIEDVNEVTPIEQKTTPTPVQRQIDDVMTNHLKGKWPERATAGNLEAVEAAVHSLTHEKGERVSPDCVVDHLSLLEEYLRLRLSSYTEQQWNDWLDNGPGASYV